MISIKLSYIVKILSPFDKNHWILSFQILSGIMLLSNTLLHQLF